MAAMNFVGPLQHVAKHDVLLAHLGLVGESYARLAAYEGDGSGLRLLSFCRLLRRLTSHRRKNGLIHLWSLTDPYGCRLSYASCLLPLRPAG